MLINAHVCLGEQVACEQKFSWLSRYAKITRQMKQEHFLFFILYMCDLHNRHLISRLPPSKGIVFSVDWNVCCSFCGSESN